MRGAAVHDHAGGGVAKFRDKEGAKQVGAPQLCCVALSWHVASGGSSAALLPTPAHRGWLWAGPGAGHR